MKDLITRALSLLPDGLAVRIYYLWICRRLPNLKQPRRFSEKLQARKLGRRDPRLPLLADKVRVKEFVKAELGEEWLVPTLWAGTTLPAVPPWAPPFIVKANHGSGWCEPYFPGDTHWPVIVKQSAEWLMMTYGANLREWHYAYIEPCLLVEPFMGDTNEYPLDYKLLVFNGRVEYIFAVARTREPRSYQGAYYNRTWERQPFPAATTSIDADIERPASLEDMIDAAERLAGGLDFVRVDFYEVSGQPKFGELTFFPISGFYLPHQKKLDQRLGELWRDFRP